ncbi:DER1-domain-containing protein [Athelia psychrophila]|uniref:Derlin n=1 Tax=Athelia psychrophila TaxID=1759441 RepID=A0A166RK17_9AGAM|nr:DER1-domain-containing protein [Fibularhizoctonia sp. CBS 109695]
MAEIIAELLKIPPVTRFLCASSLAVSVPVNLGVVSAYKVVIIWELVTKKWEIWRVFTSFFLGGSGIAYLFDLMMLYNCLLSSIASRNSNTLEETHFTGRSADYAWQLLVASSGILALSYPLRSVVNAHPLLITLAYVYGQLAPPGTTSSIMGLITIPVVYYPYMMVVMDLLISGTSTAAGGVVGLVVGHLWYWAIFGGEGGRGPFQARGRAPGWLKRLFGDATAPRPFVGRREPEDAPEPLGGVHVMPPRERTAAAPGSATTGYQWGEGRRLGNYVP